MSKFSGWIVRREKKSFMATRVFLLPDLYIRGESIKSIPAGFLYRQSAHLPSLITMVITDPCDFSHADHTLVPDNRLWARLICSITPNPPWSFKHFFSPALYQSIYIQFYQLTSPGLFILMQNGCLLTNQIGFTCNLVYLKLINIGVTEHTWLMSSLQSRQKHTTQVNKVYGYKVDRVRKDRR